MRLYGALDLAFAALYGYVGFVLAPSRARAVDVVLGLVCALLVASGVGLLLRARWARPVGIAAASVLLAACAAAIVLLVASTAYLAGVYGAIGQGLTILALVCAALVFELCGLLPLFQLRFLLKRR